MLRILQNIKTLILKPGPLLGSIISSMIEKAKNNSIEMFNFYSAIELTISYISLALGLQVPAVPTFGSSLIFELRQKKKQHFVKVSWLLFV